MQILCPFTGSPQQYADEISTSDCYRPDHCPQCQAQLPLIAHGFYSRTLVEAGFDGSIRVRRYLCRFCRRTVSLLPEFALPYLRLGITVISLFLAGRLLEGATLAAAAGKALPVTMPYQRGQFWVRRFQRQAAALCAALATLCAPAPAANFVRRALHMLESIGWIAAHRFLFADLRFHLLGWPAFLAPDGLELPLPLFVSRLATMRHAMGSAADQNLFIDTRATGHLLSAPQGLEHFLAAAQTAAAEIIVLDPLYSTHDQDENDTRAMAALCQSLLRLREASRAALIVVHHVRKSIGRYEIGSAFRGSSALHAVGDSYLLLTRPSPQFNTIELRFQFRYAAPQPPRSLQLDSDALWFSAAATPPALPAADRRKVEPAHVRQALTELSTGPL